MSPRERRKFRKFGQKMKIAPEEQTTMEWKYVARREKQRGCSELSDRANFLLDQTRKDCFKTEVELVSGVTTKSPRKVDGLKKDNINVFCDRQVESSLQEDCCRCLCC